jgi:ubiquinone/menaquinone biosynthesis C-methylase UbiE
MTLLEFNEEEAQRLLGVYVTSDVVAQRIEFLNTINLEAGERVLDVGTGPGFLAQSIAETVGTNGSVCGVDVSEFLLNVARSRNKNMAHIEFEYGNATNLPYPDEDFDSVVCTQVLEYVHEVDAALTEIHRVLRKGGKIALLDTDWDSIVWHTSDPEMTKRILTAWEAHAADPFLPRTLAERMKCQGFQVEIQKIIPIFNPIYKPDTYSNRMIDLIVPFVVEHGNFTKEEVESWAIELRKCGQNGNYFFSLNRYLFLARKI